LTWDCADDTGGGPSRQWHDMAYDMA